MKNNPILTVTNVPPSETSFSVIIEPEGEAHKFEPLYDFYAPAVYGWIRRFTPDAALADQILANTFLNVWANRHELQHSPMSPLLTLIRISNKGIENCIGKTVFQERLRIFLKRNVNVVLG